MTQRLEDQDKLDHRPGSYIIPSYQLALVFWKPKPRRDLVESPKVGEDALR